MSKTPDHVGQKYYNRHLKGVTTFAANPTNDRFGILYRYHVKRITELAINRFKWLNMPKTIDVRFLELTLFRNALAVFYFEPSMNRYLALQGTPNGTRDMLDNPRSFRLYGNQFVSKTMPAQMCVPIWANYLRVPDHDMVMLWASRIAEIEQTIEINSKNARRPRALIYDENMSVSMNNINDAIERGEPTIKLTAEMGARLADSVTSVDLGVLPDTLEKLHILRMRLENQMMSELGINNANQDKKERLVADEVDANNDQVSVARAVALNARKFAALQINDMFGLEIEVNYGMDITPQSESSNDVTTVPPVNAGELTATTGTEE